MFDWLVPLGQSVLGGLTGGLTNQLFQKTTKTPRNVIPSPEENKERLLLGNRPAELKRYI
jgi:hypothetical protein